MNAFISCSSKWVPDSDAPFQTPAHLKEAIEQFENKPSSQVPEPHPPAQPTETKEKKTDDLEFIFS